MSSISTFRPPRLETLAAFGGLLVVLAGGFGLPGDPERRPEASARAAAATGTTADAVRDVERRVDSPAPPRRTVRPGQGNPEGEQRVEYKPAVLQIVTNFKKADASVNGIPYPEYVEPGNEPGMVLPAGGPYTVEVTYDGKTKTYTISLDPYEIRYLMVELTGFEGGAPTSGREQPAAGGSSARDEDGVGRVTVYSRPKGAIQVDGQSEGQETPGTIEVNPGEHTIQVDFGDGGMSESKSVRVRNGSKIKLFFRKDDDGQEK